MHTVHQIVVSGESVETALSSLENKLMEIPENSSWFDWYQIGGRWDGILVEDYPELKNKLENPNVLPVFGNETTVESVLRDIDSRQNNRFLECKDIFLGSEVVPVEETDGHIFGVPVAETEVKAQRKTKYNIDGFQEWKEILSATSLYELNDKYFFIAAYNLDILNNFLSGRWFNETGYYDFFNESAQTRHLRDLFGQVSSKNLYLVTVDFHF
jgi:hypothetical protein